MADTATSAADLIAAAKAEQDGRKRRVPMWGHILEIAPATATQFARIKRELAQYASLGIPAEENEVAEFAWVRGCVVSPALSPQDCVALRDASPADFSNLAQICRAVSQGQPLSLMMLGIWSAQADAMEKEVAAGRLDQSVVAFWTNLVRTFVWWLNSEDGKALDFRAFGRDLAGLQDGDGMDVAASLLKDWMEREGVEAKNAPGAESMDSSAPASSGQDEAPTN